MEIGEMEFPSAGYVPFYLVFTANVWFKLEGKVQLSAQTTIPIPITIFIKIYQEI